MIDQFEQLVTRLASTDPGELLTPERRPHGVARAAVLILLSDTAEPDLLFTERSGHLRKHAGQVSFPGGRRDHQDTDAIATALRETEEEIGLDSQQVRILGELPATRLPVSSFDVAPVVGCWSGEVPLAATSPDEVAAIHRWRLSELADPANRWLARHPGGTFGPAWQFGEIFLWGFTAFLTDAVLELGGWARAWDTSRVVEVPERFRRDRVGG